ncbi:MAG: TetR-like C-terminal domain-containing protein [Rhizomicrobium sp.]
MRDIAAKLGRSPMGLYRYFYRPRRDPGPSCGPTRFDRFADALEAAFASGQDAFAPRPRGGARLSRFRAQYPNAYRLMFDLSPPDEARHPELRRAGRRAGETVTRHVKDLAAAGIVQGDPKVIGNALWAAAHGAIVLHLAGRLPAGMKVEDLYFETMRLTFRGARTPAMRARVPGRKTA